MLLVMEMRSTSRLVVPRSMLRKNLNIEIIPISRPILLKGIAQLASVSAW